MAHWSSLLGKYYQRNRKLASRGATPWRALGVTKLEERALLAGNIWSQRGGDAGHTSYVDVSINPASIAQAWNQPLNYVSSGTGSWAERAVAIDDTQVYRTDLEGYAPSGTYHVIAYNLQTGTPVWNRSIVGNAFEGVGEPSVAGGVVYVNRAGHSGISGGTSNDLPRLYGLSPQTGATVVQATYQAQWGSNERPVISNNQLVAWDGYYGGFSAWTASTLTRQWNRAGSIYDPPMSALDSQFVYAYGNQVYSRSNGTRQADITHPLGLTPSDPLVANSGRLIFKIGGSTGGVAKFGIAAYDGATRSHLWTTYTSQFPAGKAAGNGLIALTVGQQLLLLDEASGAQLGSWQAPGSLTGEIVLTRTHAFVQSMSGGGARVHAINLATRQEEWSHLNTQTGETGSAYMELAFGGGHLLLSHDAFVRAFNVSGANQAPTAVNDAATTLEDNSVTINVLANDSDPDGDALAVTAVGTPAHGTAVRNADGSITYRPAVNYNGADSFTYTVSDVSGATATATVSLTVTAVNDAPVASGWQLGTDEDTPLNDFLRASDADGDPLTFTLLDPPAQGSVQLTPGPTAGTFTYTPAPNYNGTVSFTFKVNDGQQDSNVARVFVTVRAVNDAPVAQNDAYEAQEDSALDIAATAGVLANDSDVEGSSLSAVLVSGPTNGTLTLNPNGSFIYTPNTNATGVDSFAYQARDGALNSNVATVTLTVSPVNDAPTTQPDAYEATEDTPLVVDAELGVLANDSDVDGDVLSAVIVSPPTHGTLSLNIDGSFSYTPNANANGEDSFSYQAGDGSLNSGIETVTITVGAVQDAPVAMAGADRTVAETVATAFDADDSYDADGDSLTYAWDFGDGSTGSGPTPSHAYADDGAYTVTLTVDDGQGNSDVDTLVVTVDNVAPSAGISGPTTGVRGQTRTFTLTASDASPVDQAASFTYTLNWGDGSPVQTLSGSTSISVDHTFAGSGAFTVQLTVRDKDGSASPPVSRVVTISALQMQGNSLVVGGTVGSDSIAIVPSGSSLAVTINGVHQGLFQPTERIVVFGQAGNDTIQLQAAGRTSVAVPAIIHGATGNDTIDARGSSAGNFLLGGAGVDSVTGGSGRDLLLGGADADSLRGGDGDDIFIGGGSDFGTNQAALIALMAEWGRQDLGYQARIDHLTGATGGGLNGPNLLTPLTVHDDAAVDQLYGEAGQDWFLYNAIGAWADRLNDKRKNEQALQI